MSDRIDRIEHIVDHMFRVAKLNDTLYYEITNGPETEDTITWTLTAQGVEVWLDIVYPAMHRVPAQLIRTMTREQAREELIPILRSECAKDASARTFYENKWGVPPLEG